MKVSLKIKRLRPDAVVPEQMSGGAAGIDLYAIDTVLLTHGSRACVGTGIAVEIPVGYVGDVRPRSGLAVKQGVTVINSPGTIDSDYRGEVGVPLINHGYADVQIKKGDRIAQLVLVAIASPEIEVVDELSETKRGAGGFGHTGR